MQVYLPDEQYKRAKARGGGLNVSAILQAALAQELDRLDRLDAMGDAVQAYESEFGAFTSGELAERERLDKAAARKTAGRRRRVKAA